MGKKGRLILEQAIARRREADAKKEASIEIQDQVLDVNFSEVQNALQGSGSKGDAQEERKVVSKADSEKS